MKLNIIRRDSRFVLSDKAIKIRGLGNPTKCPEMATMSGVKKSKTRQKPDSDALKAPYFYGFVGFVGKWILEKTRHGASVGFVGFLFREPDEPTPQIFRHAQKVER